MVNELLTSLGVLIGFILLIVGIGQIRSYYKNIYNERKKEHFKKVSAIIAKHHRVPKGKFKCSDCRKILNLDKIETDPCDIDYTVLGKGTKKRKLIIECRKCFNCK